MNFIFVNCIYSHIGAVQALDRTNPYPSIWRRSSFQTAYQFKDPSAEAKTDPTEFSFGLAAAAVETFTLATPGSTVEAALVFSTAATRR